MGELVSRPDTRAELLAALELEKKKRAALALCYHAQALELRTARESLATACEIALELLEHSPTSALKDLREFEAATDPSGRVITDYIEGYENPRSRGTP